MVSQILDSQWLNVLLVVVEIFTLVALIIYVWKTWQMASATRDAAENSAKATEESVRARIQSLAPRMVAYLDQSDPGLAQIAIENIGAGTALDLNIEMEPKLQSSQFDDPDLFFEQQGTVFTPGYKVRHWFDMWHSYIKADLPSEYLVKFMYRGAENGEQYCHQQEVNINTVVNAARAKRSTVHHVAEHLKDLNKKLDQKSKDRLDVEKSRVHAETFLSVFEREDLGVHTLVRLWRLFGAIESDERASVNRYGTFTTLRWLAAKTFVEIDKSKTSPELLKNLESFVVFLFQVDSYSHYNQKWLKRVSKTVDEIARLLDERGVFKLPPDS